MISTDAVTEALRKTVEGREDFVYDRGDRGCRYASNGAPSCLVGHVIFEVAPETFRELEKYESVFGSSASVVTLVEENYSTPTLDIDELTRDALSAAQNVQDCKAPWRYALMAYELVMSGYTEHDALNAAFRAYDEEEGAR